MSDSPIEILFEEDRLQFNPGETLSAQFLVRADDGRELKAVEVSVLWRTEGKGDTDLGVHHFERFEAQEGAGGVDLRRPLSFRTQLPNSPLSYSGALVQIIWSVRVRAFPQRGDDFFAEERFQLGTMPLKAPHEAAT
jgi:hypothetical protein